jgi:hypothetical protein
MTVHTCKYPDLNADQNYTYSRFHNDRHPRFLLVYVLFGSIGESSAKEALADNLPWRITPTERLPHASEH